MAFLDPTEAIIYRILWIYGIIDKCNTSINVKPNLPHTHLCIGED